MKCHYYQHQKKNKLTAKEEQELRATIVKKLVEKLIKTNRKENGESNDK